MSRRPSARALEETIPDDLLANIPDVASRQEATTFAIESEEVILASPPDAAQPMGAAPGAPAGSPFVGEASLSAALAQQLRYDIGEALARELDKATETFAAAVQELEARVAQAEADAVAARAEAGRERAARETAERRLSAFKELALK